MAQLTHEEFCKKAITSLRKEGFKGIHTVYSGFNKAFCKYYGIPKLADGKDDISKVVAVTRGLAEAGKISLIPAKNGAMMYLYGEITVSNADSTLNKMGLK
jgi:hypothetical protein